MTGQLDLMPASTRDAIRAEERAARARHRGLERAQRASRTASERAFAQKVRDLAAGLRHLNPHCRCELRGVHNARELRALNGGCTAEADGPGWVCPLLDAIRRRMGQ